MSVRRDATGEFLAEGYFVPAATAGKHSSVTQLLRAGILALAVVGVGEHETDALIGGFIRVTAKPRSFSSLARE